MIIKSNPGAQGDASEDTHTRSTRTHQEGAVVASVAKQSSLDCVVALLLAMTILAMSHVHEIWN